ncbi:glycosyltransferase [Pseudonocardia halophobica]|uniref:glycosyltransferase n=1 Tax=Pseudonocardia halophobica TaxID=29401 RepID=UPI003D8B5C43
MSQKTPADLAVAPNAALPDGTPAPSAELGDQNGLPTARVVQRGLFTGPSPVVPADLYAEVLRGTAERSRHEVRLTPGTDVSTNTYFGRFHATYWQRWTPVQEITAEFVATGRGQVRLMASDTNKVARTVAVAEVTTESPTSFRLTGPIDRFVDGGGMWLDLATEVGELTVAAVRWTVRAPRLQRPTAAVICTYNRVDDCLNTLEAMSDDVEALAALDHVYVVDQGSDPLESRERFQQVRAGLDGRLTYIRQRNLGGAGGFTRGLFEATSGPVEAQRDVLLMDDDVLLEPDVFIRLTAFADCMTTPAIVGGHMLNLLHPAHLHISAEYADPERLLAGQKMPGGVHEGYLLGRDERLLPNVLDRRVDTEYNGWWACLIPATIVERIGLPLPVFFQWDDVEYGYRARAAGFPTISLPGAAIWHADFGWKDWDEWHRFFNIRNALITAALHTRFSVSVVTKQVMTMLGQYLVAMQYGLSATLLEAIEEFLRGPEILNDGSADSAARIRRIRSDYPETTSRPIAEAIDDFRAFPVVREPGPPSHEALTWLKRAVYLLADRGAARTGMITAGEAHWWHVSTLGKAVVTDMAETGVRVRTRDRKRALDLAKRGAAVICRLHREGPGVAERYRAAVPELTSRENWTRLYGLEEKAD